MDSELLKNGMKVFFDQNNRVNADSPILAAFSKVRENERVLDIGSGSGILLFWLFDRGFTKKATAIELRDGAVKLLARSAKENDCRIEIVQCDLRRFCAEQKYDVVLCNPPYFSVKEGGVSRNSERAAARSETAASLLDIAATAKRSLKEKGRFLFCYPARRLQAAFLALMENDFSVKRLRFCRHSEEKEPWLVLIEARYRGGEALQIEKDFIMVKDGNLTEEMREITAEWMPEQK